MEHTMLEAPPSPSPEAAAVLTAARPFAPVAGAAPCVAARAGVLGECEGSQRVVASPLVASPASGWCRVAARKSGRASGHPALILCMHGCSSGYMCRIYRRPCRVRQQTVHRGPAVKSIVSRCREPSSILVTDTNFCGSVRVGPGVPLVAGLMKL
jgi:hypothetical protein